MTKNDIGTIILNWLKGFFTKNLALKIVSLLFAMLIWGYVMVEVNPKRVKTITDVPVSFSGESSLHDRGLAVRGDRDDILRNVTVRVKVQLTDYTGLDASDISASVSLRPVNKADTYKLKIDATSSLGTVENVSPSEITIEVDELATMLVPIDVEYSGELPEGYWKSEPTLASQSIKVSGPRDDVSTISKAICTINLEDRTTSYNEAILLKYVDKNGDLRADAIHHDGTNHYLYRVFKRGVTDAQIENLQDKIYCRRATRADITRVTQRLGDSIAAIYGFRIPKQRARQHDAR